MHVICLPKFWKLCFEEKAIWFHLYVYSFDFLRSITVNVNMHWHTKINESQGWSRKKQTSWESPACENSAEFKMSELASGRFGHDVDFDGLAEGNGPFYSGLWWWEAVNAVAPSQLGSRGRGWERGWGGAVSQQEAYLDLRRLWKRNRQRVERSVKETKSRWRWWRESLKGWIAKPKQYFE